SRGRRGGPRPSSAPCRRNTRLGADQLPEFLADSRTAELLKGGCEPRLKRPAHDAPRRDHGDSELMLDTHAVARSLTAADFTPAQADALTDALREFTEQGDHVTSDQFRAGQSEMRAEIAEVRAEIANLDTRLSAQIAELRTEQRTQVAEVRTEIANLDTRLSTQIAGVRTEIASLETRLIRWMVGTVLATAALTVGILRLLAE
ncbi:MAG: DUF1640 domain-containing protein, partial [Gemmatimonadetes bacterium]|nr:DUF1640 domain-containing protein [Gemmatimonadota bacterium]